MLQLEPIRYGRAGPVVRAALASSRMAEPLTVSETALKYVRLENAGGGYSGPYTFDRVPFLRRIMDCLTADSGYWLTAVMGPSQCGKSKVGDIWQGHCVVVDPADIIAVWPDKDIARSYVTSQLNKAIRAWPDLKEKQLGTVSADNIFSKEFQGSNWFHAWPVPAQLRARPVPRFRVEDYDAVPSDIGGEGDVITLLTGRQTTFEGFEIGYVNSSPAQGADRGIEAQVRAGTNESWFVDCLHCGEPFDLHMDRLHFDREGTADQARDSAAVVCPDCGGVHVQADKRRLMDTGRWVGEGQTAVAGGVEGELLSNGIAGFRITGLMGFATWPRLAQLLRAAEIQWQTAQDEAPLRAVTQSRFGHNYRSQLAGAAPVTGDELAARAAMSGFTTGQVPPGAIALTAAVDVQGNRFEVMVQAWGLAFESWVVDRFQIIALDDGQTALRPDLHSEHWRVLLQKVIWRRYPLATDPDRSVAIASTAIDTGGLDGVTENAFKFYYAALAVGVPPDAITLVKGGNNPKARLLPPPTTDAKYKKRKSDPDAPLFVPNVNRVKSIIDVRLRRHAPGPAHIHLPADMGRDHIDEITAEELIDGVWQQKRGRRNESWDLLVYNAVVMLRFGGLDGSLAWVPRVLRAPAQDVPPPPAVPESQDTETPPPPATALPKPPADHPHAGRRRRRRGARGQVEI